MIGKLLRRPNAYIVRAIHVRTLNNSTRIFFKDTHEAKRV